MDVTIKLNKDLSENVRYTNEKYPIYIKRALLSAYPNFGAPSHWHNDIELIYIIAGEMDYNINGKIITLSQGDGIFVNAGQLHFGFSPTKTECDFICILLSTNLICIGSEFEKDFILPVIGNSDLPYIHFRTVNKWQNDALNIIKKMYGCKGVCGEPLKIQRLFSELWALIYENTESDGHCIDDSNISALKDMIGYVQKHYAETLTLTQIAASGRVCVSKCCRLFKEYLKQTPNTYLINYRLDKSVELLENTDMNVTEIAYAAGFGGASYFSETFRKWFGQSPTQYRNRFSR